MNLNNVQSFDNASGAAISAYRWVKFSSTGVVYTDKDTASGADVPLGTVLHDRSATDIEPVDVSLHNCGGVHWATAGAAITRGAEVQIGDDGKIVTKASLAARGIALEAATADGNVIRVLVY